MHRLTIVLVLGLFGCGDDICRHLDPDIRVFWTQEQKEACPASPRPRGDDATALPDMGVQQDLAATPPACITDCK